MWSPEPGHPLRRLFAGLTEQTFLETLGVADPSLTDYLSVLLSQFVHFDSIYRLHDAQPLGHFGRGAVVWSAMRGAGRVVVDTLAYDADSLTLPANRAILSRALRWVSET